MAGVGSGQLPSIPSDSEVSWELSLPRRSKSARELLAKPRTALCPALVSFSPPRRGPLLPMTMRLVLGALEAEQEQHPPAAPPLVPRPRAAMCPRELLGTTAAEHQLRLHRQGLGGLLFVGGAASGSGSGSNYARTMPTGSRHTAVPRPFSQGVGSVEDEEDGAIRFL
jgi:hypothetical protein